MILLLKLPEKGREGKALKPMTIVSACCFDNNVISIYIRNRMKSKHRDENVSSSGFY